jgi:hypothetical protein
MSVTTVRNVMQMMIGKNVSATGASVQLTSPTGSNYIADGEIVALGKDRKYLTPGSTVSDQEYIYLAYRSGNNIHYSNAIYGKGLKKYAGIDGSQGNEQIYHIGYVGSGSQNLDVTAGNDFYVHITNTFNDMQYSEQLDRRTYFSTFAVPTAEKVAADITKQICIDPGSHIRAEMLNSGSAAAFGAGITATVVNDGRSVSFSSAHSLVAGDYVRIGTTTVASGIGTGIPVYKVASVPSTTTIILEWPYQGPSQSNLDANADCGKLTAGANFGIRLTGETLDYRLDFFKFMRVTFKVGLSGLGSTVLTKTQEMSLGRGDGRQVAEIESFAQGFDGPMNRVTIPLPILRTDADKSTTTAQNATYGNTFTSATTVYDNISILHGVAAPHFATGPTPAAEEVRLYIVDGAAQTAGLLAQLNPWMESIGLTSVSV